MARPASVDDSYEVAPTFNQILVGILDSPSTHAVFAQIYDGIQTEKTLRDLNDTETLFQKFNYTSSEDALNHARLWLAEKRAANTINSPYSIDQNEEDILEAAVRMSNIVRSIVGLYCGDIQRHGRPTPNFFDGRRRSYGREAVQDWSEEVIFGGKIQRDARELKVDSVFKASFSLSSADLRHVLRKKPVCGLGGLLPLKPVSTRINKRVKRLEDDLDLHDYIKRGQR